MESYPFGSTHYNFRMLYDTACRDTVCKYCHRCNQERYPSDLSYPCRIYSMGSSILTNNQSANLLSISHQRTGKEIGDESERRVTQKQRLKFSVEAILGSSVCTIGDSRHDIVTTNDMRQQSYPAEITAKRLENRPPSLTTKRAVFSEYQRRQLEQEFLAHKYINKQERKQLSARLCLTESQIRIWFQNRRMKWRNWQEREIMRRKRHTGLEQM